MRKDVSNIFSFLLSVCFITFASCKNDGPPVEKDESTTENPWEFCTFNESEQRQFSIGVNRPELPWAEGGTAAQRHILDEINSVDCGHVRFSLSRGNLKKEVRDHILYANQLGMKVTVFLKISQIDEIYPEGTVKRSGEERFWEQYPLNKIDQGLYTSWVNDLMQYWNEAGCEIDVIEVGNEFAWVDFNGDFPIFPVNEGVIYDENRTWDSLPFDVRWSVRKVGDLARITKRAVVSKFSENAPKVILGGLNAPFNPDWLIGAGGSIMMPELALRLIQGTAEGQPNTHADYLESIDGIAIHLYPQPEDCPYIDDCTAMVDDAKTFIDRFMRPVSTVTDLPVYLSEFGFRTTTYGYDQDWKRTKLFQAFFQAMSQTQSAYNWEQVHVYNWDENVHRLVTEDGELLHAAKHIFK